MHIFIMNQIPINKHIMNQHQSLNLIKKTIQTATTTGNKPTQIKNHISNSNQEFRLIKLPN